MFARSASIVLLALPLFASAASIRRDITNSCNTGSLQCCNSSGSASDPAIANQLGLLSVAAPITALVGLGCTPISLLSSGSTCTTSSVCCENNKFDAAVVIGCSPVNLNV
ncbi:hydrophobin 2 [Phlegmacium glaucopus]|nr:hydrophobin 2 [Phlegmacium glaucopus]